jgi:hypothetical protein
MNYKYHHKVLEVLYHNKMRVIKRNKEDKVNEPCDNTLYMYASELSKTIRISSERSLSILTDLRTSGCLLSAYNEKKGEISFWLIDSGITKYHEQFFKYKRKEQCNDFWIKLFKLLFYLISTIGIILSAVFNYYNIKSII